MHQDFKWTLVEENFEKRPPERARIKAFYWLGIFHLAPEWKISAIFLRISTKKFVVLDTRNSLTFPGFPWPLSFSQTFPSFPESWQRCVIITLHSFAVSQHAWPNNDVVAVVVVECGWRGILRNNMYERKGKTCRYVSRWKIYFSNLIFYYDFKNRYARKFLPRVSWSPGMGIISTPTFRNHKLR